MRQYISYALFFVSFVALIGAALFAWHGQEQLAEANMVHVQATFLLREAAKTHAEIQAELDRQQWGKEKELAAQER
jgi:hypothetical protein